MNTQKYSMAEFQCCFRRVKLAILLKKFIEGFCGQYVEKSVGNISNCLASLLESVCAMA